MLEPCAAVGSMTCLQFSGYASEGILISTCFHFILYAKTISHKTYANNTITSVCLPVSFSLPNNLPICMSTCLSDFLSGFFVYLCSSQSAYYCRLYVRLYLSAFESSVRLFISVPVYLCARLSISVSVCLSLCLPVCLPISVSVLSARARLSTVCVYDFYAINVRSARKQSSHYPPPLYIYLSKSRRWIFSVVCPSDYVCL